MSLSKVSEEENSTEEEGVDKEMSNNPTRTFYKTPGYSNFKNNNSYHKGSCGSNTVVQKNVVMNKNVAGVESQSKKKLIRESGYDFNYYDGKNYTTRDYMLKKHNEKWKRIKDESYYVQKTKEIKEINNITKNLALVETGNDSDDDIYLIW